MRPRDVLLENDLNVADSGTDTINIDLDDPITEIQVNFRLTNGATSNKASPAERLVTKIEIVDGSDVLWSLSGLLARGLIENMWQKACHSKISEIGGDSQYVTIPIRFGRFLYDPVYALNPVNFRNPQIKLTWNLAAVNAVGATGAVTASGYYTIMARVMEDVSSPTAFFMAKNFHNWTTAASGEESVDLPVDFPYCALLVRGYEAGVALSSTFTNLKLSVDGDKYIPFDYSIAKFYRHMMSQFGGLELSGLAQADDATAFENWMAFTTGGQVNGRASGIIVTASSHDNSQTLPYITNHAGTAQTGAGVWYQVHGNALHNCLVYPFGKLDTPDQWLNANQFRSVKLKVTQGNAGATGDVVLLQSRTY